MSFATWYLVFQYNTCFLKLFKFAVHTNFSKFYSFVLKLRDRISVILFFSGTKHLLMRIDPEVIKNNDQNRFFNYYILLSVFRTHKYLEFGKEWVANSRQSFFQTLHILPRSLGSMCKCKNILLCSQLILSLTLQILFFHFTFEFSTQSGPAECWETSNL